MAITLLLENPRLFKTLQIPIEPVGLLWWQTMTQRTGGSGSSQEATWEAPRKTLEHWRGSTTVTRFPIFLFFHLNGKTMQQFVQYLKAECDWDPLESTGTGVTSHFVQNICFNLCNVTVKLFSISSFHFPQTEWPMREAMPVKAKAGDVLVFSYLLVHGIIPNLTLHGPTSWIKESNTYPQLVVPQAWLFTPMSRKLPKHVWQNEKDVFDPGSCHTDRSHDQTKMFSKSIAVNHHHHHWWSPGRKRWRPASKRSSPISWRWLGNI